VKQMKLRGYTFSVEISSLKSIFLIYEFPVCSYIIP
jgi:hypothetical protein